MVGGHEDRGTHACLVRSQTPCNAPGIRDRSCCRSPPRSADRAAVSADTRTETVRARAPVLPTGLIPRAVLAFVGATLAMTGLGVTAMLAGAVPPFLFAYPAVVLVAIAAGPVAGFGTAALCLAWLTVPGLPPGGGAADPVVGWTSGTLFLAFAALLAGLPGRLRWVRPAGDAAATAGSARPMLLVMALAAVLPFVLFLTVAQYTYRQAFDEAAARAERVTRIAQEHAAKLLDTNEAIIGRVLALVGPGSAAELRPRQAVLGTQLAEIANDMPQIQSIWVVGPDGTPLATSRRIAMPLSSLRLDDRDFFRWHLEHPPGLYVSKPGIGRATGQAYLSTSRRRVDADGGFNGIVSVSLDPAYLERFYSELTAAEPGLTMALLRPDGTALLHHPPLPDEDRGRSAVPNGAGEAAGPAAAPRSGAGRPAEVVALRGVDRYPLVVRAGISHLVVVGAWQNEMALLAAALFPMSGILVLVAWAGLRHAGREQAALRRLGAEVESRTRAERALLQAQKLEALGLLTGSVAHDFNNLLAIVSNNTHLLQRLNRDPTAAALLSAIRRAVGTGTQLTRQLLSFSRRQPLRPVSVDLHDLLPETLELIRTTVRAGVTVSLRMAEGVPPVRVDQAELELALINLALNARDAMPDGGTLAVVARNATSGEAPPDRPGHWVAIGVSDTGSGMSPAVRARAFEPFFTTKRAGSGTGLGLSQVLGMCQQAGGTARIDSTEGVGTTVTVVLPASGQPTGPAVPPPPAPATLACELLLVEDNRELAPTLQALLESFGARVTWVERADEALAAVTAGDRRFDLVLSDIMMAGPMDGLALARELRRRVPALPVVLTTGYAHELHNALAAGFEVVPKPCVPEQLLTVLAAALAGRGRAPQLPAAAGPQRSAGG